MSAAPTSEERIWSAISHLSSLALGMGIVLPIVGWSDQRRKSNYAAFQNLQALGYQSLGFTVWILTYLVVAILGIFILLIWPGTSREAVGTEGLIRDPTLILVLVVLLALFALYLVLPIVAAVACALGKDFRYPWMGDRLARYLGYDPLQKSEEPAWLIEEHELRWVAAMGHFSILVLIWGMLAPLTAWILYGKQSLFLRFQSIQTLVYQAGVTILYFGGGALYGAALVALIVFMERIGQSASDSASGIFGLGIGGVLLLISGVILLLVPLFHILGQWAGYRVLKGDDYRYPLVGRLVEKQISKTPVDS
jgi:uncharacterized Tic20 family protein